MHGFFYRIVRPGQVILVIGVLFVRVRMSVDGSWTTAADCTFFEILKWEDIATMRNGLNVILVIMIRLKKSTLQNGVENRIISKAFEVDSVIVLVIWWLFKSIECALTADAAITTQKCGQT